MPQKANAYHRLIVIAGEFCASNGNETRKKVSFFMALSSFLP